MTDNEKYNKLYNNLLPSIIKLINNYQFIGLSQEKIESLIKDFLLDIYNNQGDIKQQNNDYIKKIKSYLDAYIKITIKIYIKKFALNEQRLSTIYTFI